MAKNPPRRKRADCFLGIHFDYHCRDDSAEIGKTVTRKMLQQIVERVRPDFIQCDCKGHRGLCSYPTKVGHPAPGFVRDQLLLWREVTAANGVALYLHYSGVWDDEAVARHPSWARIDAKGKRDKRMCSVFGPYADRLLIPQLKELSDDYDIDGVWIDGECWATVHDYAKRVLRRFQEESGIATVPRQPEDPGFFEFSEFCREGFRRYLRHYVDELHRHNPDFQIASNWAFTSHMPGPVTANVDYLSGDYSMQDSVNTARFEARVIAAQGKPWDLMAWSFAQKWGEGAASTKSAVQLQREAALVISQGGGFQAYFKQKADCSIQSWTMKVMAPVGEFCRQRQPFCFRAESVPQVAVLFNTAGHYRVNRNLFAPAGGILEPIKGVLNCLLDAQQVVDVVQEHALAQEMGRYPLIVVPCFGEFLGAKLRRQLRDYVADGGSLLLVGPVSAKPFAKELQVRFAGPIEDGAMWLEHNDFMGGVKAASRKVVPGPGVATVGQLFPENDNVEPGKPAATIASYGKGKIAAVYVDLGARYRHGANFVMRDFMAELVQRLMPRPIVEVAGSHYIDVALSRPGGKLAVHLVNTAGPHANPNVYAFDEIPPVGPLTISVRAGRKPKRITLQPSGAELDFAYRRGRAVVELPRLEIYEIIVLD